MDAPPLRVSRPVSACSRCRSAKIKCDGKLPACTACRKSGRADECFSANDQFAKGKERSYVASLESHVERLQKEIAQAKVRNNSVNMLGPHVWRSKSSDASMGGIGRTRRKEASDVDDLLADFGFLSVNATARDFHGFTQEVSFARLVLSTSSNEEMPQLSSANLPSREAAHRIVEHYYKHLFLVYPILSEVALYGSLDAVYQQGGSFATQMDHWNLRMVLAIALASLSRSKGDSQYQDAVRHVSAALEHVEAVFQPGSVLGIRAILLLVHYALLDPSHFRSWYLIGVASRAMVDLGLHQDPPEELRLKDSQLQLRRCLFYCVYVLDRAISISNVRAFSFTDDSASVSSSSESISVSSSTTLADQTSIRSTNAVTQTLKFWQIQSTWYQALLQSNREAVKQPWQTRSNSLHDMLAWYEALPTSIANPLRNVLRCEMLFGSILLISPPQKAGDVCKVCRYGQALLFEYAVEYVETMQIICESGHGFPFCTSLDILRVSYTARSFLDILQESFDYISLSTIPEPPLSPPCEGRPPPLPIAAAEPKLDRAIAGVQRMINVMNLLEGRFGNAANFGNLRADGASALQNLHTRGSRPSWDPLHGTSYISSLGSLSFQPLEYYRG